jgi:hypothetical protein
MLCCEKRFTAKTVEKMRPVPRTTLYKYLVIEKEHPKPDPELEQPRTPTEETRPTMNPFAQRNLSPTTAKDSQAPEIKRRTLHSTSYTEHEGRPRSDTLPFVQMESLQSISSMRSGHGNGTRHAQLHPKYDEQDDTEQ